MWSARFCMNGDRYVTIPSTCCSSETVEGEGISLIALTLSGSGCAPSLSYIVPPCNKKIDSWIY